MNQQTKKNTKIMTNTSTHPDKCIGNVTLDLKRLYQSMPKHLQKKVSLHDLKLICDAYNGDQPPVDNQFVADGCEKFGHWPEEPANPICANTSHKFSHCDCKQPSEKDTSTETCPSQKDTKWRELGPDEVICEGDEYFLGLWLKVNASIGLKSRQRDYRFRTRRPLPKQEEMPLEKAPDDLHAWMRLQEEINKEVAGEIRYLRDEIQKLKEAL
jgi:hypothetical protein